MDSVDNKIAYDILGELSLRIIALKAAKIGGVDNMPPKPDIISDGALQFLAGFVKRILR